MTRKGKATATAVVAAESDDAVAAVLSEQDNISSLNTRIRGKKQTYFADVSHCLRLFHWIQVRNQERCEFFKLFFRKWGGKYNKLTKKYWRSTSPTFV